MTIFQLIFEFMKIGLFSIGGGMATLPFLYELADKYPWFTALELTDMIAISESTPGPIGANMATFAGYRAAGIPGGIVATLALVFPSIVVIILISMFLKKFRDSKLVQGGFYLIRPATAGLIAGAISEVFVISLFNTELFKTTGSLTDLFMWIPIATFIVLVFVIKKLPKLHPVVFMFAGAAVGVIFKL